MEKLAGCALARSQGPGSEITSCWVPVNAWWGSSQHGSSVELELEELPNPEKPLKISTSGASHSITYPGAWFPVITHYTLHGEANT